MENTKPYKRTRTADRMQKRIKAEYYRYAREKAAGESDEDNPAVEGADRTAQAAEYISFSTSDRYRRRHRRKRQEKRTGKKEDSGKWGFNYGNGNTGTMTERQQNKAHKEQTKRLQKQHIKREYTKAGIGGKASKNAKAAVSKSSEIATAVAKKIQEIAARNATLLISIGAFSLLLVMIMCALSSCGSMFSDGISTTMTGAYLSLPPDIDAADVILSELEMGLQEEIDSIEDDYPDYDEYRYFLDPIGHDPFVLINYLSAEHTQFFVDDVKDEISGIYEAMYSLTLTPKEETRTGTRTVTDPETGETSEEEYEYTVKVLEVSLTNSGLEAVVEGRMDSGQKEVYDFYGETQGLLQEFDNPVEFSWYENVSSYYGYRKNRSTGEWEFHRGVDIAVPSGTNVHASIKGKVTEAASDSEFGNYVVIENSKGYCTKYAHLDSISVSAGQKVQDGEVIGTAGSTLHIECLFEGIYFNPLFYFDAEEENT